jgi:hypothetical protein
MERDVQMRQKDSDCCCQKLLNEQWQSVTAKRFQLIKKTKIFLKMSPLIRYIKTYRIEKC